MATAENLFMLYRLLQWIFWCAMDYCSKFNYPLRATVENLVMSFGPLQRTWLCAMGHCMEWSRTVKICDDFHDVGCRARFGYALWATTQAFVMCYGPRRKLLLCTMGHSAGFVKRCGPWRRIWLRAMGHYAGFCYVLWATTQAFVMYYGP